MGQVEESHPACPFSAGGSGKGGVLRPRPRFSWDTAWDFLEPALTSGPRSCLEQGKGGGQGMGTLPRVSYPPNPAISPFSLFCPHTGDSPGLAILLVVEW